MAIDPTAIGAVTEPHTQTWTERDTMLYALFDVIANDPNAGFRPAGSAGLPKNFTAAADVNGQTIRGMQLGFVYKF